MSAQPEPAVELRYQRLAALPMRPIGGAHPLTPRGVADSIREIVAQREMLGLLVQRDLKAKYKDSALGFLWSLARPLVQLLDLLRRARPVPRRRARHPGLRGLRLHRTHRDGALHRRSPSAARGRSSRMRDWSRRSTCRARCSRSRASGSALFNFGVQLVVLLVATLVVGYPAASPRTSSTPSRRSALILVYGLAFALFFGALNVYLRDMQYLVEVFTMLLFWASPVVYSWRWCSLDHHESCSARDLHEQPADACGPRIPAGILGRRRRPAARPTISCSA